MIRRRRFFAILSCIAVSGCVAQREANSYSDKVDRGQADRIASDVATLVALRLSRANTTLSLAPSSGQGAFGAALDGALRERGFALAPFPNADAVTLRYRLWSNPVETGVSIQVGHLVAARVYPNGGAAESGAWSIREDG